MPDASELCEVFGYQPDEGYLYRRKGATYILKPKSVGCLNSRGYWVVGYKGRRYFVHRLIWKMAHGVEPNDEIDHIDRNKTNNRIENLRDCTGAVNSDNRDFSTRAGRGVSYNKRAKLWRAYSKRSGSTWKSLGYFKTEADALAARASYDAGV